MSLEVVFMHNKTIQIYFVTQKKTQSNPKLVVVSSSRCTQVLRILFSLKKKMLKFYRP